MKKITSLEYNTIAWYLIRACFAELTFTTILYNIKQDSWISIILGTIIGLLPFFLYEYFKNKFPNLTLIEVNKITWKKFGNVINFIILIGSLIIAICTFWIFIHFANSLFLYKTSAWIISIAFIIPIWFAANKDIHVLSKVSLILFYITIIFTIFIILGLTKNIDISNIKPFFENNLNNILNNSLLFVGINISKLFFLSIIPKNQVKKYSLKTNLLFYLIICFSLFEITFTTICVFGIDLSTLYEYPAFQILKRVNILGVLDRIENILSIEALFSLFIQSTLIIYYIKETISKTFNLNKKTNKYIITFICLIIYFTSNIIFVTHESSEKFFTNSLIYITYIILFFIPLLTFTKGLLHGNNLKQKQL